MATDVEELLARIEHLEQVVYDELEHPAIVYQRNNRKDDLNKMGIKVLEAPPEPAIELTFDKKFFPAMESGRKTVTFRRTQHGRRNDLFAANDVTYIIREVSEMNLKSFISLYWDEDGFESVNDAVEWFTRHYDTQDDNPPDLSKVNGYMHRFEKYWSINRRFTR